MPSRKRSAAVVPATPRSAEPKRRLARDQRELAAAIEDVRSTGVLMASALARLDEATAWLKESRREARRR